MTLMAPVLGSAEVLKASTAFSRVKRCVTNGFIIFATELAGVDAGRAGACGTLLASVGIGGLGKIEGSGPAEALCTG